MRRDIDITGVRLCPPIVVCNSWPTAEDSKECAFRELSRVAFTYRRPSEKGPLFLLCNFSEEEEEEEALM